MSTTTVSEMNAKYFPQKEDVILQNEAPTDFYIIGTVAVHLRDMNDPIMEGVLLQTEDMLVHGRMDLLLNLCFATLRGDDLLLHQLLKRGLDPNESDSTGRTALHIEASKGSENCVLLLLNYGADPNCKGSN